MTFIDLPIEGEKSYSRDPVDQRPDDELAEAFKVVFAFSEIEAIRWRQYTPYWNDGEPCVFNVYGTAFKCVGCGDEIGEHEDGFIEEYDSEYDRIFGEHKWEGKWPNNQRVPVNPPNPPLTAAVWALERAMDSGAFDALLLKTFGDHAVVTATREKFSIEFYEHG